MSQSIGCGEGRPFRRARAFERAAANLSRCLPHAVPPVLRERVYRAVSWVLTSGRGFRAELPGGEVVRLSPACRHLSWNPLEYAAFRAAVRPGDVVLDVGANAGAYTVLFARWVGERGRVYAFEPVPSIARALRAQLRLNGVSDRVNVIEAAVGAAPGRQTLIAPGVTGINRAATSGAGGATVIEVPVVTIDGFCESADISPSVIKMDVEGAELTALRGAARTIASTVSLQLFAEFHPTLWPEYGISPEDVRRTLAELGLRAEPLRAEDDVWTLEGVCARLVRSS